mmetsp:Transcript_22933/g.33522  ORF Transcript_22933/g.33522 Transcript_22933/m.33522 type:complete len:300 (+) Transcript_22933:66-965(+)
MSLGWQGESALLPRKAKPIKIDDKSMMRLKATVLDEKQKLEFSAQSKAPRLRANRGARSSDRKDVFASRNKGVEEREKKDLSSKEMASTNDRITSALTAKAKIYDTISKGGGEKSISEDVLVDFQEKSETSGSNKIAVSMDKTNGLSDSSEVVDDNCRTYSYYGPPARDTDSSGEFPENKSDRYAWSTGREDPQKIIEKSREFSRMVADEIDATVVMSSSSRVRSQWEKTLQGESRVHLERIHEETTHARKHAEETTVVGVKRKSSSGGNSTLDQRREFLRKKQEEKRLKLNAGRETVA